MKVSQILHAMGKDDKILIEDANNTVDRMTLYHGEVRGIKRGDPINKMHVEYILADGETIVVLAERSNR